MRPMPRTPAVGRRRTVLPFGTHARPQTRSKKRAVPSMSGTRSSTLCSFITPSIKAELTARLVARGGAFARAFRLVPHQALLHVRQWRLRRVSGPHPMRPLAWANGGEAGVPAGAALEARKADGDEQI